MSDSKTTLWRNPTARPVRVSFFTEPGKPFATYTIAPMSDGEIPSEYDSSVHQKNAAGLIVGGHAPQLVKVTDESC